MGTPLRVEIDTPFVVRGTKLRVQDDDIPRSFVALELVTSEQVVNEGSVVGTYDDADDGRSYLLGLHCRLRDQEFQCYLRHEGERSYAVYRIDRFRPMEA